MKKRDIIRMLTWGLTFIILAVAGIYGMILNNNYTPSNSNTKLETIINYINENVLTKELEKDGITLSAETTDSKITISYVTNTLNKKYYYTYSNNNLYSEFENNDDVAKEILKIVLAATTESLGKNYSDIMLKFYDLDLTNYNINEGLSYEETDKTNIIINTSIPLLIKEADYFTNSDLSEHSSEIIDGNYTTSKNTLKLNINNDGSTIITISEEENITLNSYKSILSILNIVLEDKENINYFKENYPTYTLGNKTFNGFKIEINPTLNNNEKTIFRTDEKIIRVTINKSQLGI